VGKGTEIVHHIAAEQRHDIISDGGEGRGVVCVGYCGVLRVGRRASMGNGQCQRCAQGYGAWDLESTLT
jgi:hypothetical protein